MRSRLLEIADCPEKAFEVIRMQATFGETSFPRSRLLARLIESPSWGITSGLPVKFRHNPKNGVDDKNSRT
jgi:hypothetical protein